MTIGEQIINEIIKQGMIRVAHPDPDVSHVFAWNANTEEQLTALVEEWNKPKPSFSARMKAFKRTHGIRTHSGRTYFTPEADRWIALIPFQEDVGKTLFKILSESCNLYNEHGMCATGKDELSAIRKLCEMQGITCEL